MDFCGKAIRGEAAMNDLSGNPLAHHTALRRLAEVRPLCEKVEDWMRVLGYPGKDVFAVRLALNEAVINAFRHGNQGDPGKVVRVGYLVTHDEVIVAVEDEGPGFDPGDVPDPRMPETCERVTGRGLFLMRVYMSGVAFNRRGNRVTLCRRRSRSS
ncbi:MAG TPA: ATP-binding protein [Gemmataceae bacterium]|nr:ATP-binding protein [Gemmataceae bacterium]